MVNPHISKQGSQQIVFLRFLSVWEGVIETKEKYSVNLLIFMGTLDVLVDDIENEKIMSNKFTQVHCCIVEEMR